MRLLMLLLIIPVFILAQEYLEASGQTTAFTLSAGSKAGWNSSIAVEKVNTSFAFPDFRINGTGNGFYIRTGVKGELKLFDLRGRIVTKVNIDRDGFYPLNAGMPNGIYVSVFTAPDVALKASRLAVVR